MPAEIVVVIEHGGDLGVFDLMGSVDGPGITLRGLGDLSDGEHRFAVELEPGGVYEVFLDVQGSLLEYETRAATAAIRLAVDSPLPEPGAPLHLAIGALVLAFARRRRTTGEPGPGSATGSRFECAPMRD